MSRKLGIWSRLPFVGRLLVAASTALIVAGGVMAYVASGREAAEMMSDLRDELATERETLPGAIAETVAVGDFATLQQILDRYVSRPLIAAVRFEDTSGVRLVAQDPTVHSGAPAWFVEAYGFSDIEGTTQVIIGGRSYGQIQVRLTAGPLTTRAWGHLKDHLAILLLAILIDFFGIWLVLRTGLTPLRSLQEGARRMSMGDMTVQVEGDGSPELREVITAFNQMVRALAASDLQRKRQAVDLESQHQRLKYILEGTNVGTWEWNVQTGELVCNERWAEIAGYSLGELAPLNIETWTRLAYPDDLKRSGELLEMHFSGRLPYYDCEVRMRHKNGHWIWVRDRGKTATWTADGRPLLMCGTHMDITGRKEAEAALLENEAKFRTIFNSSLVGIGISRLSDGIFIDANDAFLRMLGYQRYELQGKTARELDIWPDSEDQREILGKLAAGEPVNGRQGKVRTKSGEIRDQLLYAHAVSIAGQHCFVGMLYDNTEQKNAERQLEALAQLDSLTSVANRRHFLESAEQELARTKRYGGAVSLLMIDIDLFKQVNDTYGHQVGDMVLRRFAKFCRESLRGIDLIGRMGGEEFAVLMPQTDREQTLDVAERLRKSTSEIDITLEHGLPVRITISIGVVTMKDARTNMDTLLSQADSALYEAKRAGRNRVCVCRTE